MSQRSTSQRTDFSFRRVQLNGTSNLITLPPLRLPVPRQLTRRLVYFSCAWHGFQDWDSVVRLDFNNGSQVVESHRQRFGTMYTDQRAFNTYGSSTGDMPINGGTPAFSVMGWDGLATPAGTQFAGCPDCLIINGVTQTDAAVENPYTTIMYPWLFMGELEEIRFKFELITGPAGTPVQDAQAFIELYLGCKSFSD